MTETQAMYGSAKKATNMQLALKAVHEQRANYELLARITGELDDRPGVVVNFMQTKAYIDARSIIFEALKPYPELRSEISRKLRLLANEAEQSGS